MYISMEGYRRYTKYTLLVWIIGIFMWYNFVYRPSPSTNINMRHIKSQDTFEVTEVNKNIYFLETSCFYKTREFSLNPRQACAIESAATVNPDYQIHLLHTCTFNYSHLGRGKEYVSHVLSLPNVKFLKINTTDFVRGTPLEQWWNAGGLSSSAFPIIHGSDALRLVTLWKYGGTYMDLDYVFLRPFGGRSNFIGVASEDRLGNGALSFDRNGIAHEFLTECIEEFKAAFNVRVYESGPDMLTRMFRWRCKVHKVTEMTKEQCDGFSVLPPEALHPIPWYNWKTYWKPAATFPFHLIEESFGIHVWNKMAKSTPVAVGSDVAYGLLAGEYCPRVYYNCGPTF